MKLKSMLAALCLALAGGAQAATILGTLSNALTPFGNAFYGKVASFTDYYTFTLAPSSDAYNVAGITFELDLWNWVNVDLTSASLTGGGLSGTLTDSNPGDGFSFTALTAGNYTLAIAGAVPGYFGGVYAGVVHASAVPEPEQYAMMLTGLLMVGWSVRRRNAR